MKKFKLVVALLLIVAMCVPLLAGCAEEKADLKITVSKLGYGTDWLKAIAKAYEAKTGITIQIEEVVGGAGVDAIYAEQESLSSNTDIFITRHRHFFETIYKGKITAGGQTYDCQYADLTDVYNDTTYGKSILEKMKPQYSSFLQADGKFYGLPWAEGCMGIIRNKDVWNKLGLSEEDIPLTTDEMFALCETIKTKQVDGKSVAPFIYSWEDEYYTSFLPVWFAQYEGVKGTENFLNGLDPMGQQSHNLYAYDGLEKALEVMQKLISKSSGYQHEASADLSFSQMQAYFLSDQAVFNVNGNWLETEMGANYAGKNLDYIKTPVISALSERLSYYDKNDAAGNDAKLAALVEFVDAHPERGDNEGIPAGTTAEDAEIVREARHSASYLLESIDHIVTVPAYCKNLTAAKDFLKFMYSDEALQIYYEATSGQTLPLLPENGYDNSKLTLSPFRQSINQVLEEGYLVNWYDYMPTKLFSLGSVGAYYNNGAQTTVMKELYQGKSPSEIITNNINYLESNWTNILSRFQN